MNVTPSEITVLYHPLFTGINNFERADVKALARNQLSQLHAGLILHKLVNFGTSVSVS